MSGDNVQFVTVIPVQATKIKNLDHEDGGTAHALLVTDFSEAARIAGAIVWSAHDGVA